MSSPDELVTGARQLTMKTGMITDLQIRNLKILAMAIYGGPVTITITPRVEQADFETSLPILGLHSQGDIRFYVPGVEDQASPGLLHPQDEIQMIKQGVAEWLGPKWSTEVIFDDDSNTSSAPAKRKRGKRAKVVRTKRKATSGSKD